MKFVFVGDEDREDLPAENPASIVMYGLTFALNGDPVEVKNPDSIARLRGNSHFKEVGVEKLGSGSGPGTGKKRGRPRKKAAVKGSGKPVSEDQSGSEADTDVVQPPAA